MPSNTAASMFGGAGGRGSRASVASLEGLLNVLRKDPERNSTPAGVTVPGPIPVLWAPAAPADDKQTLRGLNDRLSGYLGRVKQLERENRQLKDEIDDILVKRKTPEGRDWGEVEKPLNHPKNKIKDITKDNAKLLLQIDNTKLANADFMNKLNDETKARKAIENDLDELRKNIKDTKLSNKQTQKEIDLVKDELAIFEQDHKNAVDNLCEKIKNSGVNVEIETPNSNLPEIVNNIRKQYDKLGTKNLKETEDWYQSKFENIKVEEAKNTEALQSSKMELKDLSKQKKYLEIKVQGCHTTIHNLEETLRFTKLENGQRLAPLNRSILDLEQQLKKMRAHVENQLEMNKDLLCVKMKLEAEINEYQQLISGNADSLDFSLKDCLPHDQQKPEEEISEEQKEETEVVKQENRSDSPEAVAVQAESLKKIDKKVSSSSSSSSSSSESEEEKAKNQDEVEIA
ncbi:keratin, type I cytoskeletal 18-like [Corythoichthys intestinalis]|uniref:keratin, type I cytoskeletal 18-like n=1 Tax=Corythoichthys intestinalis TaxID=161448 RepID=UPI0025A5A60A|nr:keratin, type I cytoskeletal 18-like [Corythoichthys intestinalis]XP_061802920.1 keratin, type I cytoskeletal 18-like [Nerophis lumbriciformis]